MSTVRLHRARSPTDYSRPRRCSGFDKYCKSREARPEDVVVQFSARYDGYHSLRSPPAHRRLLLEPSHRRLFGPLTRPIVLTSRLVLTTLESSRLEAWIKRKISTVHSNKRSLQGLSMSWLWI